MAKMRPVAERKAEYERNYPEQQKRAIKLVDEMMKEGMQWSDARRILRMANSELEGRRSEEIMERAEDARAPMPS